jgi:hypothetical protein
MLYDLEITLCSMLYELLVFYETGHGHLLNISLQINVVGFIVIPEVDYGYCKNCHFFG